MKEINKKMGTDKTDVYRCTCCNYTTNKRGEYNKHIQRTNHSDMVGGGVETNYICDCGKKYKHRQSLFTHKKKCNMINKISESNELMLELIKNNLELQSVVQNVVIEQNNMIKELTTANEKLVQNTTNSNNTTTNTMNHTTNNQFNLNFFLNEKCKDAINMTEFIKSINVQLQDLEDTARLGHVEGISRIFIRALNDMDVEKRPIHCTDVKRETVYVKDQDNWEKDNSEKNKLRRAVDYIVDKNMRQIDDWKEQNPNWEDYNSEESHVLNKIYINALGGVTPDEERKFTNKIIKNVLQEVVVDKTEGVT